MKNEMSLKAPLKCSICGRACFNESEKTCCENSHEESIKTNIIFQGDCIEELKKLDENSVDAIITDPPYGIGFMGKKWDSFKPKNIKKIEKKNKDTSWGHIVGANSPALIAGSYDFSLKGKIGFQEWMNKVAIECLRILKPGGFLLVFGGTRTYHRLVCGIEDAGFEIRDTIMWLYGSGFPKSLNVGKQVDKIQGNKRESKGIVKGMGTRPNVLEFADRPIKNKFELTEGSSEWEGWGTALKPAHEPIVVARKPLSEKNVALNVLKWGTGAINIDACRIKTDEIRKPMTTPDFRDVGKKVKEKIGIDKLNFGQIENAKRIEYNPNQQGRFPANLILDEEAGKMLDIQSGVTLSKGGQSYSKTSNIYGKYANDRTIEGCGFGDSGGASRFFYCAKASKSERNLGCEEIKSKRIKGRDKGQDERNVPYKIRTTPIKNIHPTVKPIKIMEYLIKLVTRKGAIVLDPFMGSGTTAIACLKLGRKYIGIEKEKEYIKIAKARIKPFSIQKKL